MNYSTRDIVFIERQGLEYMQFKSFNQTGLVKHCFTTRKGGLGQGDFKSLNLKYNIGDDRNTVESNYDIICQELGFDSRRLVFGTQPHGDNVLIIKDELEIIPDVDGFITDIPKITLVTNHADCCGLLFLDPVRKVIANSHAGWKGIVKKIGQKTILKMIEEFKCNPKDILAGICPSIGNCCFEVSSEVENEFKKNFTSYTNIIIKRNNKIYIDLWNVNKLQLKEAGLKSENIFISGVCTMCNEDRFFSYRRDKERTGRMAAMIELI